MYVRENNIEVPRYCESVIEIFQEEHGINFDLSYSDLDDLDQLDENNMLNGRSFSRDQENRE